MFYINKKLKILGKRILKKSIFLNYNLDFNLNYQMK